MRFLLPVELVRILQKEGEKSSTLVVVIDGQTISYGLPRDKLLHLLESGFEALRRQEIA